MCFMPACWGLTLRRSIILDSNSPHTVTLPRLVFVFCLCVCPAACPCLLHIMFCYFTMFKMPPAMTTLQRSTLNISSTTTPVMLIQSELGFKMFCENGSCFLASSSTALSFLPKFRMTIDSNLNANNILTKSCKDRNVLYIFMTQFVKDFNIISVGDMNTVNRTDYIKIRHSAEPRMWGW